MKKHLKDHEVYMKSEFAGKCNALTKYFNAVERKTKFTGLDRMKLKEKLKTLKKQFRKDKKEGSKGSNAV